MFAGLHSKFSHHFPFPFSDSATLFTSLSSPIIKQVIQVIFMNLHVVIVFNGYICKGAFSPAGALKIVAACPMNREATIRRRKDLVPSTVWGIRACLALPSKFTSKKLCSRNKHPMEGLYRFCVYTVTKQINIYTQ